MSTDAKFSFEKGKKFFAEKNFAEALNAFTQSINIAPQDNEYRTWFTATKHFVSSVYPEIKANNEKLVDCWPAYFIWDKATKQNIRDGTSGDVEYGTWGQGYLALTEQNLRIVSLGELAKVLKPKVKLGGFWELLDLFTVSHDFTSVPEVDFSWKIPNSTIQGAQITTRSLVIVTAAMTWNVYVYENSMQIMANAINTAITISDKNSKTTVSQTEIIQLLKELGELRERGIITEAEFDEKKKELLSRL